MATDLPPPDADRHADRPLPAEVRVAPDQSNAPALHGLQKDRFQNLLAANDRPATPETLALLARIKLYSAERMLKRKDVTNDERWREIRKVLNAKEQEIKEVEDLLMGKPGENEKAALIKALIKVTEQGEAFLVQSNLLPDEEKKLPNYQSQKLYEESDVLNYDVLEQALRAQQRKDPKAKETFEGLHKQLVVAQKKFLQKPEK